MPTEQTPLFASTAKQRAGEKQEARQPANGTVADIGRTVINNVVSTVINTAGSTVSNTLGSGGNVGSSSSSRPMSVGDLQEQHYNPQAYYSHQVARVATQTAPADALGMGGLLAIALTAAAIDGPFPMGDILGTIFLMSMLSNSSTVIPTALLAEVQLPQQGTVPGTVEGAPPVDAGQQGKHVQGHKNDDDPTRSKWPAGETGVTETQEGWLNGEVLRDGTRVWDAGRPIGANGETGVRVHQDSKVRIHGYPVNPHRYLG